VAERFKLMKNFNDIIGNRTRVLPAFSAMPQTTALPRAPTVSIAKYKGTYHHGADEEPNENRVTEVIFLEPLL